MGSEKIEMIIGFVCVFMLVVGVGVGFLIGRGYTMGQAGYFECIETLPRNQDCKLIAVPVEEPSK